MLGAVTVTKRPRPRPAMGQLDLGLGAVAKYRYDPTLPASTTTTLIVGSEIEILHRYRTPPLPRNHPHGSINSDSLTMRHQPCSARQLC